MKKNQLITEIKIWGSVWTSALTFSLDKWRQSGKRGVGWEAEGHLSQAAKPMWTTSSSPGLFLPTSLPFLPLDFCCLPTVHVAGLFVSFGFDLCLPYFRVGFIKCLSGSFRAFSLFLSPRHLLSGRIVTKGKPPMCNSQWSGWPQLQGEKEPEDNSKWSQGLR